VPFSVAPEEEFGSDDALRVDHEGAGIRQATGVGLEDSVVLDDLTARVGQHGEGDIPFLGELGQDRDLVVADANDLDVGLTKGLDVILQLDQLLSAERSPVSRSVEDQGDRLALDQELGEGLGLAVLVLQGEVGSLLADRQARRFACRRSVFRFR